MTIGRFYAIIVASGKFFEKRLLQDVLRPNESPSQLDKHKPYTCDQCAKPFKDAVI